VCGFVSRSAIGSQTVTCPSIGRVCLYQGLLLAHSTLRLLRPECHLSSDWSAEPLHLQSSRAVCLLYADTVSTDSISSSSSSAPALSPDQHPTSHGTIASDFFYPLHAVLIRLSRLIEQRLVTDRQADTEHLFTIATKNVICKFVCHNNNNNNNNKQICIAQ